MSGLPRKLMQYPFSSGLAQKTDIRETNPPALDICVDGEFDNIGSLRTRFPYAAESLATIDGAGLDGPVRRVDDNDGELVLHTNQSLYSWSPQLQKWARKDTRLAATVQEADVFGVNDNQFVCDRAELNGVSVVSWVLSNGSLFVGARDTQNGAVLLPPTQVTGGAGNWSAARLVPLLSRIMLFGIDGFLFGLAIDPANLVASVATSMTRIGSFSSATALDALAIPAVDTALVACVNASTYQLIKVTAALSPTILSVTPTTFSTQSSIAVALDATASNALVVYAGGVTVTCFADVVSMGSFTVAHANINVGAMPMNNSGTITAQRMTAAFGTVGGVSAFWVFFTGGETTAALFAGAIMFWSVKLNSVTAAGVAGTATTFVMNQSLASRAFVVGASIYVWTVFAGATVASAAGFSTTLQNTNFLFRADGLLVGQCLMDRSGGFVQGFSNLPTCLPNVQAISSTQFKWCATARRMIVAATTQYSGLAPCEVTLTFDDQRARRSVRLGKTLTLTGAQLEQYDGAAVAEVGFHLYPWTLTFLSVTTGGNLSAGPYAWKQTLKWTNASGDVERSTTATVQEQSAASGQQVTFISGPLFVTRKIANPPNVEFWRTQVNPIASSPFFLVSSTNPNSTSNPNRYVANTPTATTLPNFQDGLSDAAIAILQEDPEDGNELPQMGPPPANVIAASDTRIFLADVAGQPNTIWYSQQRDDGEVATFNSQLTFEVPTDGGDITAIVPLVGGLIVARQTALYLFSGDGFDNTLGGANYALSRTISTGVGIQNQESQVFIDEGIYLKSARGWYLLDLGWNLNYIGAGIANYDAETIIATHEMTGQHQIRAVSAERIIFFDTIVKQWGEYSIGAAYGDAANVSACVWNGQHVYTDGTNVYIQQSTYTGVNYGMDIETAWIKLDDLQSRGMVWRVQIIGEYRGAHFIRWRAARDYLQDGSGNWLYYDDKPWQASPTTIGSAEQCRYTPSQKRCQAIKLRLSVVADANNNPATNEALRLTGVALDVGIESGLYRGHSTAQEV